MDEPRGTSQPDVEIAEGRAVFADALRHGDAKAAGSVYSETARLLAPSADLIEGREAIEAFWQAGLDAGVVDMELDAVTVERRGRLAYELGRYALQLRPPAGGTVIDRGSIRPRPRTARQRLVVPGRRDVQPGDSIGTAGRSSSGAVATTRRFAVLRYMKATFVAGVLAVALTQPVAATPPVTITIEATRLGPIGSFESSGAFADSGTFEVRDPVFGGPGPGKFVNVHATETFTGSAGTFTLARKVRVTWGDDPNVRTIDGNWEVIAGTGAYQDLQANGRISGTAQGSAPPELFVLTYAGKVDND